MCASGYASGWPVQKTCTKNLKLVTLAPKPFLNHDTSSQEFSFMALILLKDAVLAKLHEDLTGLVQLSN